jgi:ribonuclease VapC
MQVVLDASALLAYLRAEPGSEAVDGVLGSALITSVNWAEVLQKSLSAGVEAKGLRQELQALGLAVEPFSAGDADTAALLWPQTRNPCRCGFSCCAERGCRSGVPKSSACGARGSSQEPHGQTCNQQPKANSQG